MYELDKCDPREGGLIDFLKHFAKQPRGFCVLAGENGTGKTYLAKACVADCKSRFDIRHHWYIRFSKQKEIQDKMSEDYRSYGHCRDFENSLNESYLLVIDDLGTRKPSEAFIDLLYSVVDYRYENDKGTIITTNRNSKQLREIFGDAFVSRVASGKCYRLEGEDRRFKEF